MPTQIQNTDQMDEYFKQSVMTSNLNSHSGTTSKNKNLTLTLHDNIQGYIKIHQYRYIYVFA